MNLSIKVSVVAWLHKYYLLNYAKYIIYMKIIVFHSHFWHPSLDDKACLDWVSKNQTQGDRRQFRKPIRERFKAKQMQFLFTPDAHSKILVRRR